MIYFTADLHLGHQKVIEYCNRPFSSVEEMDEELIYNWNKRVKPEDTVYILGDLIWDQSKTMEYLNALSGIKILIAGNHDEEWLKVPGAKEQFGLITRYYRADLFSRPMTLCHYPMLEWDRGFMIHGHIHNNYKELYDALYRRENILNAGVDVNEYMPVTFAELIENNRIHKRRMIFFKGGK